LSKDLKADRHQPDEAKKDALEGRFEAIFLPKTDDARLDWAWRRLPRNREEWLWGLKRPPVPLHTNGRERNLREPVIRKKISGTPRSDLGRQCRETFLSLKKTCRKLGLSFWPSLLDRIQGDQAIPSWPELVRQRALSITG
jgi:hypothetical protein